MTWSATSSVILITIIFSFVVIVLNLPTSRKSPPTWLLFFLSLLATAQLVNLLMGNETVPSVWLNPVIYLLGPSFYLTILQHVKRKTKTALLSLLPGIVLVVHQLLAHATLALEVWVVPQFSMDLSHNLLSFNPFFNLIWVVAGLFLLYKQDGLLDDGEISSRVWYLYLAFSFLSICILELSLESVLLFFQVDWFWVRPFIVTILLLSISLLSVFLVRHPEVICRYEQKAKYQSSGLSDEQALHFLSKLNSVMRIQEYYTDTDLSLNSLADKMNIAPHYLSQILNQHLNSSFYSFINNLRVEKAKSLLCSSSASIEKIGYESGFNSKATFYSAFKKATGKSPGVWRDHQTHK